MLEDFSSNGKDKRHDSASTEDIAVQFFSYIQLTSLSPGTVSLQKCFSIIKASGMSASENAVKFKARIL
ncbi:hypothetical protein Tco_0157094 [Tanacetum coccineum]